MVGVDEFLEHHGVKGQRWGVRKKRSVKETKVRSKRAKALKNRRTLSDADVKKIIDRISEEKKLKSLVSEDLKPGRAITKKILSDSGQKIARTVVAGAGLFAIKAALDKKAGNKVSLKDAAGFITPKPKNK